ncbi:MAG: DUF4062 domain-containing protein [Oscillospiraceae bacterium]|nr:DUF4062 domain-containing protein [Oscillospiraceae bacterium]
MNTSRQKPVVFVSSTCYDLKQIREDLKDFFENNYGFDVALSEFSSFPIDPCVGTFENCLNNVDRCADIFILIIGTRYGYVTDQGKSITNLEYLHAKAKGIPIFIFVSKQLYNNLPLWKSNKDGDFSSVVDNPQIFEFVSEIYDEARQWVYTYESVRDIQMTLKNQLGLIFSDGLNFKKIIVDPQYDILNSDIPAGAIRALIEQPYVWEYKFLAYVLKNEFDKLQKRKWDLKYGIFEGHTIVLNPVEFLNDITNKFNEIMKLTDILGIIINSAIKDAMGEIGVPSDLEMIIYVSKQLASIYERLIGWALYFKSLCVDEEFTHLLQMLYNLPKSALDTIDDFIERIYNDITAIPDVSDNVERKICVTCSLNISNTDEINNELQRLMYFFMDKYAIE